MWHAVLIMLSVVTGFLTPDPPQFREQEIDDNVSIGYGLAIGDVDGDGLPDIYFCNLQGPNALFRNLGDWRFEQVDIGAAACQAPLIGHLRAWRRGIP